MMNSIFKEAPLADDSDMSPYELGAGVASAFEAWLSSFCTASACPSAAMEPMKQGFQATKLSICEDYVRLKIVFFLASSGLYLVMALMLI